jgi:16S rRNA (cytosine967-C5)-methyltransferase
LDQNESYSEKNLMKLFGVYWYLQNQELPPFPEFKDLDIQKIQNQKKISQENIAVQESYPDWMVELLEEELGRETPAVLKALNQKAEVVLRANRLKCNRDLLQKKLQEEGIYTGLLPAKYPDALVLKQRQNVFVTKAFKEGLFEVQDGSSQLVAPFMKVEPGLRIVDACAGAGGKTLHMASMMKNKGKIIAMDVEEHKLAEMKKRLRRAGVDIVEARVIDSNKVIKRMEKAADRVLLDVPCSGLGVLRRNPDSKWKMSLERIAELKNIQQQILENYSIMVKPGGYLIYSTCSLLPSENRKQVDLFLEKNLQQWQFEDDLELYPNTDRFDGFYMARLKRL